MKICMLPGDTIQHTHTHGNMVRDQVFIGVSNTKKENIFLKPKPADDI